MRLPSISSTTPASSERFAQRLRVREMLRGVRQHQLNQLSTPLDHTTDVASVLQTGTTAASASAFGDPPPMSTASSLSTLGVGPSSDTMSSGGSQIGGGGPPRVGTPSAADIAILIVSLAAFTLVFVVVGQCIDALLGVTSPSSVDETSNASSKANNTKTKNDTSDTSDTYGVIVAKTIGQIIINVALLVVPYFILAKYASHTLVFQYYAIVAAFWVVSLHAQEQLRNRFSRVLEGDSARLAAEAKANAKRDAELLAAHAKQAQRAKQQAAQNNPHQMHLNTIHRHHHNSQAAPLPRNPMPQPASHTSASPIGSMGSMGAGMSGMSGMYEGTGSMGLGMCEDAGSMGASPMASSMGPSAYEDTPMQFYSSDLLAPEPRMMASSDLSGGGGGGGFGHSGQFHTNDMGGGLSRETDISELMR